MGYYHINELVNKWLSLVIVGGKHVYLCYQKMGYNVRPPSYKLV